MHAEQEQPDNHAGGKRTPDGSDGGADEGAAGEVQIAEDFGRTSFRDDQAVVWVHALLAQGAGESTDGMESDDPGLQPQTGLKSGELRETDASGGGKNAAKRLKRGGRPLFSFRRPIILPIGCPNRTGFWKRKNRRPKLSDHRPIFFLIIPPEFSHGLATC